MTCPSCGTENRPGRKFCVECGAALALKCPACGSPHEAGEKFCGECGGALAARPEPVLSPGEAPSRRAHTADNAEARKVVTIIFADLIGSTSLHERLDAESVARLMERYYRAMRGAVEAHGGTVVKLMGDGVMAAFGVPRVAEDDAIRAVRAGVAMQDAFREFVKTLTPGPSPKMGEGNQAIPPLPSWERGLRGEGVIGLRVGINTGEVVVSADNTDVVGDPVNVAARLQTEAHDGEVVIGESTRRLVAALVTLAPLGSFALKGRTEAMKAYRVESLDRPVGTTTAAFVGRDDELARLTAVYEAAVSKPAARLAVLLGSPGLGKSRLIEEVTRRLGLSTEGLGPQAGDTASVVTAQCDAAGGATFAPVAEALREFLRANRDQVPLLGKEGEEAFLRAALEAAVPGSDAERTRIIDGITALLAGSPASPEETFFIIRRFLAALAATRPVVLVIDDLQWAEPLLLDFVEHLVQWGSGVPLLVLVGARPELRDVRSSLVTPGGLVSDVITLSGLDAGAAMRLAANVIGAADLPAAVAAKVLARSEGNPLFVGELVRMLVDEGAIERQGERWIVGANLASLEMPPTIHALLAARIERLRPEERSVLERAAVVGRHFSRSAVAALLRRNGNGSRAAATGEVPELDARLEALRRTQLIERDAGWFLGEPVLRFHHVLIRDAAYRRLLKGTRAELHEQLADWIEAQVKDAAEHDETIGWHLEQAHQHRRELGPLDAQGKTLGERAAQRLAAAGRRALARDDLPVAAGLLGRAIDRLDSDDPSRADLALDWCEALLAAGDVGTAQKAIEELGRFIDGAPLDTPPKEGGSSGRTVVGSDADSLRSSRVGPVFSGAVSRDRLRAWHTCFTGQLTVLTAPQALNTTADAVAAAAEELATLGDAAGEAKAHFVNATALARLGKVGACEAALDQALAAARRAGDRRRANAVLAGAPLAALWGPSPVTRASGRCLDVVRVLRITQGAPAVESVALSCQGVLEALRGRSEAARRMLAASRKMVEDLGIAPRLFEADAFSGRIAAMEGDPATAEQLLRGAYEGLRDLGLGIDAARAGALFGRTLLAQDRVAEAEALSHQSEALAGDDLQAAIAWRGVRAEALARRGEHAAAVEMAQAAVAIASATDALLDHADARVALAAVLRAAGRAAEADAEQRRAIELWDAKGATLLAERARRDGGRVKAVGRTAGQGQARGGPGTARPTPGRRVRANAAARNAARIAAAIAVSDPDAFEREHSDSVQVVHHSTGVVYDRPELMTSLRAIIGREMKGLAVRDEPLAGLGDSLALSRLFMSFDSAEFAEISVGAVEAENLMLAEVDATGRRIRTEIFATGHLGEAITRLYERYAELLPEGPDRARAEATARSVRVVAPGGFDLAGARSLDGYTEVFRSDVAIVDHCVLGWGSSIGPERLFRSMAAAREVGDQLMSRPQDVLALTHDALLLRWLASGVGRESGGAFEWAFLRLFLFDPNGRVARYELFDADREAEALARFEELVAAVEPQHTVRRRVTPNAGCAAMVRIEAALAAGDFNTFAAEIGPAFEEISHPTGATYGREAMLRSVERFLRLPGATARHELLATRGDRLWLLRRWMGASAAGRTNFDVGEYEKQEVGVNEVDEHGLALRNEIFAADRDELIGRGTDSVADWFENAAARADRELFDRFNARDWAGVEALAAPELVFDERRRMVRNTCGREVWLEQFRVLFDVPKSRFTSFLRATRGDRLSLNLHCFEGEVAEGGGPLTMDDHLVLHEVDGEGRIVAIVLFDLEDADAAYAELGARWTAGEALAHPPASKWLADYLRFFAARDWHAMTTLFAPDLVGENHRLVGWGTLHGPAAIVSTLQAQIELAPDTQERVDHVRTCEHAVLFEYAWHGTREGGAFENVWIVLVELDADGRARRADVWEAEQLEQARARFEEIATPAAATARFENTASRAWREVITVWGQRDRERFAASHSPALRHRDHRRLLQLDLDCNEFLAFTRPLFEMHSTRASLDLLATRGERLALMRSTLEMANDSVGPSAIDSLLLIETDERGEIVAYDRYDVDDDEAARAEIQARWESGEGATHTHAAAWDMGFDAAVDRRDWDAAATVFAPTFVAYDHRLVSWGTLHGAAGFLVAVQALVEPAPDVRVRTHHVRASSRALLLEKVWLGTRDGGAFETPFLGVIEFDGSGRAIRMDVYDPQHLERALVRFAEVRGGRPADSPSAFAKTNAMTALLESWPVLDGANREADWEALRASCAADMVFEDRQAFARLCGDREMMIASLRERVASGARAERRVLGTAGERVAVTRMLWTGGPPDGRFEIEYLTVVEADAAGRVAAILLFDAGDKRAAQREAWTRWAAIEPLAAPGVELLTEIVDAWNEHDRTRLRARFADDLVVEDHRHAGLGRIEGADAYVDSNVVLWELAPDQRLEVGWSWPAVDRHGLVVTQRRVGTLADGGAFESEYVWLALARGGRFTRLELFEMDALDAALARFEELRAARITT